MNCKYNINLVFRLVSMLMLTFILASCGGDNGTASSQATVQSKILLFVPLYIWPDLNVATGAWSRVITAAKYNPTVAIINPNSGPIQPAPQVFFDGIRALQTAGVVVLGYVPTGFGQRAEALIHADMDVYFTQYGTDGIFLDEVETTNLTRFQRLCAHTGAKWITLNPGTAMPNTYISGACKQAVVFEGNETNWHTYVLSVENTKLAPTAMVALVHSGISNTQSLQASLDQARQIGIASVFVTDVPFGAQTWNALPSYFDTEARLLGNMRIP